MLIKSIPEYLQEKHNVLLTEQQIAATEQIDGNILLLAVPGAGKTTVLVSRIANEIYYHNIPPKSILTVTFSKISAIDMKHRFIHLFGELGRELPQFSTIHSFCLAVLKLYTKKRDSKMPNLLENTEKYRILSKIYYDISNSYLTEDEFEKLSGEIGFVKNMLLSNDEISRFDSSVNHFAKIYKAYNSYNRSHNMYDFDDMLCYCDTVFERYPQILSFFQDKYHYINVDEAQDTSKLQHKIISRLSEKNGNLFMVGDEDQSIYGFRGAFPQVLLNFSENFPNSKILKIEENFRSSSPIVNSANKLITFNKQRIEKKMSHFIDNTVQTGIIYTCLDDITMQYQYVADKISELSKLKGTGTISVLYRNNDCAVALIDILNRMNLDFFIKDHKNNFRSSSVVIDVYNILSFAFAPDDIQIFSKIYYKLNCYISKNMFEYAKQYQKPSENLLDTLLTMSDDLTLEQDFKNMNSAKLRYTIHCLDRLKRLSPSLMIESIETDIEYLKYLTFKNNSSNSYENDCHRLAILKSIAKNSSSIDQVFSRLSEIDKLISEHSILSDNIAVTLSTLHSSKGLEYDTVFMIDLIDGIIPLAKTSDNSIISLQNMEEERRLFYVGITRAKTYLELITSHNYNNKVVMQSRFINQTRYQQIN